MFESIDIEKFHRIISGFKLFFSALLEVQESKRSTLDERLTKLRTIMGALKPGQPGVDLIYLTFPKFQDFPTFFKNDVEPCFVDFLLPGDIHNMSLAIGRMVACLHPRESDPLFPLDVAVIDNIFQPWDYLKKGLLPTMSSFVAEMQRCFLNPEAFRLAVSDAREGSQTPELEEEDHNDPLYDDTPGEGADTPHCYRP